MVSIHLRGRLPCIARSQPGSGGTIRPSSARTLASNTFRRKLARAPCATLETLETVQRDLAVTDLSEAQGPSSSEQDTSDPHASSVRELTHQATPYDAAEDWKDRFGHYGRQVHAFLIKTAFVTPSTFLYSAAATSRAPSHCTQYGHLVRIWQVLAVTMNPPSNGTAYVQRKPQVKLMPCLKG